MMTQHEHNTARNNATRETPVRPDSGRKGPARGAARRWAALCCLAPALSCIHATANNMKKQEHDQTVKPPAPLAWALEYLPEYFTDEPAEFHRELFTDLEDAQRRLLARVAPRGHAKSTCAAFAYPLWCICEQSKRNIVIITHESSLAAQFLRDIRSELESNPQIIAAYGDLCTEADPPDAGPARKPRRRTPRKWTETLLTTSTGITVQAKGCGASIRGTKAGPNRPDLIICDDIEKDDLVRKPANRRRLEHWLRRAVMPALAPDGRLLVLGSLIHYDSLLANLSKPSRFKGWDYRVYRAMEATKARTEQGTGIEGSRDQDQVVTDSRGGHPRTARRLSGR